MKRIVTKSEKETQKLAAGMGRALRGGEVLGLVGELGAGKTCFIQGLARGLGVPKDCYVSSPTFTILKVHKGRLDLYHFDFYRLDNPGEFEDLAFDDYLSSGGVTVIEWADKFDNLLPKDMIKIYFKVVDENSREISFLPSQTENI